MPADDEQQTPAASPSTVVRAEVERATYTADEVAAMLGCDPKSVYAAASRGELPCRRLGRRVIFPRVAIESWLADTPAEPSATRRRSVRRSPRAKPAHPKG
jgi:excisionase family DNA binding protein